MQASPRLFISCFWSKTKRLTTINRNNDICDGNGDGNGDGDDLCAADRGAGEASIGAGVKDTEALVEDADGVVHVGRVVCRVVALASGKASLEIWSGLLTVKNAIHHNDCHHGDQEHPDNEWSE